MSTYDDREQTKAKHFILQHYLQRLAFKVLNNWDIVYVDGFSGPWESKTTDFSDTSFIIAITVLKDAQRAISDRTGVLRKVKCFFSEKAHESYNQMVSAVSKYHSPQDLFEIKTFNGNFIDAIDVIRGFMGPAFPLIFIDPTGWTDYPFHKISPLFVSNRCEVLINFMYDHVNRFLTHPNQTVIDSLNPILGGPGWQDRLDPTLRKGPAVEKMFRETLKQSGNFEYVVSTKIDKSTQNRPHFFLAYGTKSINGLKTFREVEYEGLRQHARSRSAAMTRRRETLFNTPEMFSAFDADQLASSIDEIVAEQKQAAKSHLILILSETNRMSFSNIVKILLQAFMLRETNVKDICVELADEGKIQNTWGNGNRKPNNQSDIIIIN